MTSTTRTVILKWLLLIALLVYAVSMTVWASGRAAARLCPGVDVRVSGAVRPEIEATVKKGIQDHLGRLIDVKGKSVGSMDLAAIQQWISALNNLDNATCAFAPDGRLVIRAVALMPEMRVFGPGGESYYVNRDGKRMTARPEFFVDVPIVTGKFDKTLRETSLLPLVRRIHADPVLSQMVAMIDVRGPKEIYLIPRVHGHVVNVGDTNDISKKLTALKAFYRKVMPVRGWQTYEQLSLKYAGRVVATLRNKPVVATAVLDTVPDADEAALENADIEAPENPAPLTANN